MLSTFPPTACGIATFSAALSDGLVENGDDVSIVRVGADSPDSSRQVRARLDDVGAPSTARAFEVLNGADVAIIQHEYGIYGGEDGETLVDVLACIDRPVIVVAHTVLGAPTSNQRAVLDAVTARADAVVVMTEAGRKLLIEEYVVDERKVTVIPHGAAVPSVWHPRPSCSTTNLLTWGLLGPGKGIEWAIDALAELGDLLPHLAYTIAGDTHPKVRALEGEAYREMLIERVFVTDVGPYVEFDAGYRGLDALAELIDAANVVILPYDSPDQVTSGVLVDAIAAGCPVIATAFPHSVELLGSGAGLVVPRCDPHAMADAIRRFLTEPGLADSMTTEARRLAPSLAWTAIAARYASLAATLVDERAVVTA